MIGIIFDMIGALFKGSDQPSSKNWETLYQCTLVIADAETRQPEKQWPLELQVCGDQQRIKGREPDVDLLKHPCYTAVLKPWLEKENFVVLAQGGFYNFQNETYYSSVQTVIEDRGQSMESMNMDELESLVQGLQNNKQPHTELGQFAIEYAQTIQAKIESSKIIIDNFFSRGTNDQSESKS